MVAAPFVRYIIIPLLTVSRVVFLGLYLDHSSFVLLLFFICCSTLSVLIHDSLHINQVCNLLLDHRVDRRHNRVASQVISLFQNLVGSNRVTLAHNLHRNQVSSRRVNRLHNQPNVLRYNLAHYQVHNSRGNIAHNLRLNHQVNLRCNHLHNPVHR